MCASSATLSDYLAEHANVTVGLCPVGDVPLTPMRTACTCDIHLFDVLYRQFAFAVTRQLVWPVRLGSAARPGVPTASQLLV